MCRRHVDKLRNFQLTRRGLYALAPPGQIAKTYVFFAQVKANTDGIAFSQQYRTGEPDAVGFNVKLELVGNTHQSGNS